MAYYRASVTLALSHSFARHNFAGAIFYAQAGACIGICGPGRAAVSRVCPFGVERPQALSAGLVLLLCAAYAATDEFHQAFVPSRTASLRDVMTDICGATLAVLLYWSIATRRIMPSRS